MEKSELLLLLNFFRERVEKSVGDGDAIDPDIFKKELEGVVNYIEDSYANAPAKQLLFVEDGSVDLDELQVNLSKSNPEIKVVVYRQGSRTPEFANVGREENI